MKQVRLAIVGFGTVGQGLAELLLEKHAWLRTRYHLDIQLVGVASARSGFMYNAGGLDIATLLALAAQKKPLNEITGVSRWPGTQEGLDAIAGSGLDVLVEATNTNLHDGEPGLGYIRTSLSQGVHVVTANKGPMALAADELFRLAHQHGVQLRAEATVMAGTPVISTIREGMAGARVRSVRGILNGTTNYILSAMAAGRDYAEVLAEAQAQGYAEADPTADVEGFDAVAKTLILAVLVFGHRLKPEQVRRKGITQITQQQIQQARQEGKRIKLVAWLHAASHLETSPIEASVEPVALPLEDPLARVDGALNAIAFATDTLPEVTVIGPGAGRRETGQGMLADIIAIMK
jgi:homoserine dehydrogenase